MNYFNEELKRRSETVINVSFAHDGHATLQDEIFIKALIKMHDTKFYRTLLKRPNMTFSFGDKYFAPVYENVYLCIPKNADTSNLSEIMKDSELAKEVQADFKKMKNKQQFSGYFNISERTY